MGDDVIIRMFFFDIRFYPMSRVTVGGTGADEAFLSHEKEEEEEQGGLKK